ncbi:uncharacterized protein [Prorops nasuta]|uniref:uncharacterized protein n=1 Tax=Prorops nasuta TaxID=863751 RepID=UPI0034CFFAD4
MKTRTKEADSGGIAIFLIILLQISKLSCTAALTFDNQLVIVSNDCYTRVAIGSKLPDADVLSTTEVKSISECEDECSRRRNLCNSFSFGVGTRGNGTCAISGKTPKPDDLSIDPDYDVYIRSQLSPYCAPDKLYKIGDSNKDWVNNSSSTGFGNGLLTIFPNVVQPQRSGGRNESDTNRSNFKAYINDEERRITDIVRNRNPGNILDHPFFGNHFAAPHRFNDHPVSFEEDTRFHDDRGNNFGQRLHPYDTNDDYYDTYSNRKPFIGENRHFTRPNIQHSIFDNEEYAGNYNFHKNDLSSSTPKPLQSDVLKSTIFNIARSKSPTKNFGAKAEESSSESPASAGGFQHSSEFFDNNPTSFHNEAPNVFSSLISVQDGYPQTALRPFNYWTNRVPGGFHYRTNRYRNNWDDYQDSPKFNDQFSSGKSPTEFGRWTGYNGGGTHPYSSDGSYSNRNVFTNPLFIHNLPKHTTVKPTDTYWTTPTPAFFQYTTIGHLKRRDQNSGNLSNNSDLDYTNPDDAALTTPSGYGMKIQEEPKC